MVSERFWEFTTSLLVAQVQVTAASHGPRVLWTPVCHPWLGKRPCRSDSSPPPFLCPLPIYSELAQLTQAQQILKANYLPACTLSTAFLESLFGIFHYYSNTQSWLLAQRPIVRLWWPFSLNSFFLIFQDFKFSFTHTIPLFVSSIQYTRWPSGESPFPA